MEKNKSEEIPLDVLCMQLSEMTLELLKLIDKNEKSPALSFKMREVELLQERINNQKKLEERDPGTKDQK